MKLINRILFLLLSISIMICTVNTVMAADASSDTESYSLFYDDFENYEDEAYPKANPIDKDSWSYVVYGKSVYSVVPDPENDGNKILGISVDKSVPNIVSPRLEKSLNLTEPCNVEISFKVKTCGQHFALTMYTKRNAASAAKSTTMFSFDGNDVLPRAPRSLFLSSDKFINVNVKLNLHKNTYSVYFDGVKYMENAKFTNGTDFSGTSTLRFMTSIMPGNTLFLDDVIVTTDNLDVANFSMFYDRINSVEVVTPLVPLIRETHPRIYLDDFGEIRAKINSDILAKKWYYTLKKYADTLLKAEPEEYLPVSNILTQVERRIMYKLYVLSFVYGIEENDIYKERALEEIRNAGSYPSWHPNNFLGVAEVTNGISVAYDWMYNGMTAQERKEVEDIIINRGITLGVQSYEGISETFFVTAESNWNIVCNGGMMTAAVALADNYPEISEYIFQHAAKSIPLCLAPIYAPQGASPEGTGYWEYATVNLVHILAMLDSAIKDDAELPAMFDFSNAEGFADTLDFPIATSSTYSTFNYGDNALELRKKKNMSIAYWMAHKYGKPQYSWYQLHMNDLLGRYGETWKLTQKLIWYSPSDMLNENVTFPLDKAYIHSNGPNIVTLRSSWADSGETYVGIQGGSNQAPHQYFSLGTFVIDALDERWATMRGPGNYRWPGYFGNERGNYYIARTEGQNCVVLNFEDGSQQNKEAVAQVCAFDTNNDEAYGVIDLTSAYSKDVNSYKRGIRLFDGRTKVLIQDDIQAKDTLNSGLWFMHTDARVFPSEDGKSAVLVKNNKRMYMEIVSGPQNSKITVVDAAPQPSSPNPEEQKTEDYGRKIAIDISGEKDIRLSVLFVPLSDKIAPDKYSIDVTPIDEWKLGGNAGNIQSEMSSSLAYLKNSPVVMQKGIKTHLDDFDTAVFEKDGEMMVPIRKTAETFDDTVSWNNGNKTIEITHLDKIIEISSDGTEYTVEDVAYNLTVPVTVVNGISFMAVKDMCRIINTPYYISHDGLVIIGREISSDNTELVYKVTDLLKYRLYVNGEEIKDFSANNAKTSVLINPDSNDVSDISVISSDGSKVNVSRASSSDGSAYLELPDRKIEIELHPDELYYATSNKAIDKLEITDSSFRDLAGTVTWVEPVSASASAEGQYSVEGICDNDINTLWSSQGYATVEFDFGKVTNLNGMSVSCDPKNGARTYVFSVEVSENGKNWIRVLSDQSTQSGKVNLLPEIFELGNVSARYARLIAQGNNTNDWNLYHELRFYNSEEQKVQDMNNWNDYFKIIDWNNFKVGQTMNLTVSGICKDKTSADFTNSETVFSSDNEDVVKVSADGRLEAVGIGEATVAVMVNYHGIKEESKVLIRVVE